MTDQWKDRIIRGGAIAVMTVAALRCMVWLGTRFNVRSC